ncbi:polysaccharide deacetylase family protein [Paenalkalicoccus suaedae]|uniref:Polysaccharide deacetylase family protein n=1 Tax=Paenalkalicoccus suaedae TaxID=2592382 RepID=A0A859FKQ2_9BACI|nr:polysaccharide deacetylase family protein [Paenalkalicoccus suaedae]
MALTFDDGPGRLTSAFLDCLEELDVGATFFWQTRYLHHKRPFKRALANGHSIGSHAHKHRDLTKRSFEEQFDSLQTSVSLFSTVMNHEATLVRPPYGQYNKETQRAVDQLGLRMIMWDVASFDWELKEDPEKITRLVVDNVKSGSIVLLHELPQTLVALPAIVHELRQKGYHFVVL